MSNFFENLFGLEFNEKSKVEDAADSNSTDMVEPVAPETTATDQDVSKIDPNSLTVEELSLRGEIAAVKMITFARSSLFQYPDKCARSYVGIKNGGDLSENEKYLITEIAYFGLFSIPEEIEGLLIDSNMTFAYVAGYSSALKNGWPNDPSTRFYVSMADKADPFTFINRATNAFVDTYKDVSELPVEEIIKIAAPEFLVDIINPYVKAVARKTLTMSKEEVEEFIKFADRISIGVDIGNDPRFQK